MSLTQTEDASKCSSGQSGTALGARGNWWGNDDREVAINGHDELPGVDREAWVAGKLLRGPDATLYCPECWHDHDRAVPLSDPGDYVPPSEVEIELGGDDEDAEEDEADDPVMITVTIYSDHRRHRHCTDQDCGYVSWGGILADRPMGEFLEIVRAVLDEADLPSRRRKRLVAEAQSRKAKGQRDESNMEKLLHVLRWGEEE